MNNKRKRKQYGIGGDIGAGVAGVAKGVLGTILPGPLGGLAKQGVDTIHSGLDDDITSQEKSIAGYGQAVGAAGAAVVSGGTLAPQAISEAAQGIGQGVAAGSPNNREAQLIGQGIGTAGQIGGYMMGRPSIPTQYNFGGNLMLGAKNLPGMENTNVLGFAMGGNTQLSEINNGGTHEQNPNGGVPMGQTASVEQGETKWEDYIFSDRIKVPGAKHTFADESKKIQKKYPKERENDVPTQSAKRREMERLMKAQEALRTEMGLNDESQVAAYGGRMKFPDGGSLNTNKTDTIFTNDPKDPRLKAYNDSLSLYNLSMDNRVKVPSGSSSTNDPFLKKTNNNEWEAMLLRKRLVEQGLKRNPEVNKIRESLGYNNSEPEYSAKIGLDTFHVFKKPVQPVAYKNPESRVETTTDSKGRTVYPNDKVSDKAKKYFAENPSMFNAIGAPKMETTIDTNKDAIIKSLNNSKTVSKTPSSIPAPALKWLDEPGITGWQQAYDPSKKKTAYRPVTMGADGKPTYGPIEYAMGGRIKMNNGGIDPNSFLALNQTLNPNLGNLGQASIPVPNAPLEEEYVAPTIYDTTPVETVKRTFSSNPTSNNNLARTDFLGIEHPSFVTPATKTTKTAESANTTTTNNVTDSGLETPKPKGSSGFDKYDAITMGAQLLPAMYNIGQGLRKQKPVDLGRMTPNLVNYDSSRKASEDSFNQQANILNESIRENATSSGQALSNRVAFANRAALDKANQLGQINEREYNTNQQIRGNADQVNLQIRANEEMIDAQNKGISQTSVGMGLAQIGQAAGTINRDRNLRLGEKETIRLMGEGSDFGYEEDPETGNLIRVYKNKAKTSKTKVD